MSLFDSASLVVTPSGYKEDKLYSIKPTDGSGDLVVTRATTATRVNSDGLIEVVPYNLLTFSNTFTNAIWTKDNVSLTSGITSPSGLNNAFKLVESATTGVHSIYQTFVSLPSNIYTTSIYVKKGERFKVAIADRNSGAYVSFNLNTGTIISSLSLVGTIELLNNDWYRLTAKTSSAISVYVPQIFILEDSYTTGVPITLPYAGNGTSGIFIYAAQFEAGATAKEYFPTTDRLDVPRLDYTNSSCPSILVEPQRTNLATYSEQFDNANWVKLNSTITANTSVAPTGNTTADTLTITSGGYLLQTLFGYNAVSGQSITISIFAKNQITNFLTFGGATLAGTDVYTIQDYGNGWYRHITTRTFSVTNASAIIQFIIFNQIGTHIVWGAQLEAGSYATSYIPTIASSVTRNADVISKTGISSLIGQTEGTIFVDFNINNISSQTNNPILFSLFGNATIYLQIFTSGYGELIYSTGAGQQAYLYWSSPTNGRHKLAMGYKANDFVLYIDGVQIATDSSGSVDTLNSFYFGYNNAAFNPTANYKTAALFKTRLSNTELAQLTTI